MSGMTIFSDLSQSELAAAAEAFEEQVFGPGTRLLRKGFSGTSFFVVAVSPSGDTLAAGTEEGLVRFWKLLPIEASK